MRLVWTVRHGWATCVVSDARASVELVASYITPAPEDLLTAVTRLVLNEPEAHAEFDAEPTVHRWSFHRTAGQVDVSIHRVPGGTLVWHSRQPLVTVARSVIRAFDTVATDLGEPAYLVDWRRPFPRRELETLRAGWLDLKQGGGHTVIPS